MSGAIRGNFWRRATVQQPSRAGRASPTHNPKDQDSLMRIRDVRVLPLLGPPPDEGWSARTSEDENLYTLVELISDEGVTGLGSIYTSRLLVEGALGVLRPFLVGASALDPARVTETLRALTSPSGTCSAR
jgi:L-alanine-DL-glutamate epimerase-like enolase superfamily enzyme